MILVGLVLFRDMPFTLLVNVLVDWITNDKAKDKSNNETP